MEAAHSHSAPLRNAVILACNSAQTFSVCVQIQQKRNNMGICVLAELQSEPG